MQQKNYEFIFALKSNIILVLLKQKNILLFSNESNIIFIFNFYVHLLNFKKCQQFREVRPISNRSNKVINSLAERL